MSRNPFLSRAGFDKYEQHQNILHQPGRNPFLSRAGFDLYAVDGLKKVKTVLGRNPFLSRAGFDNFYNDKEEEWTFWVAIPF